MGEMITLDLAVINRSDLGLFFFDVDNDLLYLYAVDDAGRPVRLIRYGEVQVALTPEAFRRVDPFEFLVANRQVVVGYDAGVSRKWEQEGELIGLHELDYSKARFDRDLFINYGNAWLDAKPGGTYTITAQHENTSVVVSRDNPKMKTAAGKIVSSPLTITIVE